MHSIRVESWEKHIRHPRPSSPWKTFRMTTAKLALVFSIETISQTVYNRVDKKGERWWFILTHFDSKKVKLVRRSKNDNYSIRQVVQTYFVDGHSYRALINHRRGCVTTWLNSPRPGLFFTIVVCNEIQFALHIYSCLHLQNLGTALE